MRKSLLSTAAYAVVLFAAGAAAAQTTQAQQAPDTDAPAGLVEEVVVTAQKREENLQDVPSTVTAVSGANLQRQGVNDLRDIQKVAPEVTVAPGAFANIAIRGIRTGAFAPTSEGTNAVHIDGVYLSRFTALNGLFFDVQRVEVLAGPQGTLYGRNSAGGTINIISNRPAKDFGGRASLELGNYNAIVAQGAVNLPVSDTLSTRIAFYRNERRGYNDNGTDDQDLTSARFSALWEPTERDTVLFTADIEKQGGKGAGQAAIVQVLKSPTIYTCPGSSVPIAACGVAGANGAVTPRPAGFIAYVPAGTPGGVLTPIQLTGGPRDQRAAFGDADRQRQDNQTSGAMVQWDHDMEFATLTTQLAWRDNNLNNLTGSTGGFTLQDPRLLTLAAVTRPSAGLLNGYSRWFSEEVRLTSNASQPLQWLIGLYGFQEKGVKANNGTYLATFPNGANQYGQVVFTNPPTLNNNITNPRNVAKAYAIFGQATYTPPALENLHLTAGLRYNTEKRATQGRQIQNGQENLAARFDEDAKFDKVTYKLNLAYDFTPDNMVYVDHSTGFKAGGFAYGPTPEFAPETIKAYEIGTKNRFLDGRLQVNASAWHYDYKNYVTTVNEFYFDVLLNRPNGYLDVTNAGSAKIDGQTVQVNWNVTDNDRIAVNVTHLKARFDDFNTVASQAFAAANGLLPGLTPATYAPYFTYDDSPIGGAMDWSGSVAYDHVFEVAGGKLDAQVMMNYRGEFLPGNQVAPANVNAYLPVDSATTFDLSARYDRDDADWSVTLYVRNMLDKDVVTSRGYSSNAGFRAVDDPQTFYAYRTANYGAPRTFGVIFNADF